MKSIFASKTFWLAVVQLVVGIVVYYQGIYPSVGELVIVKSFLDMMLRYFTTQPVAVNPQG